MIFYESSKVFEKCKWKNVCEGGEDENQDRKRVIYHSCKHNCISGLNFLCTVTTEGTRKGRTAPKIKHPCAGFSGARKTHGFAYQWQSKLRLKSRQQFSLSATVIFRKSTLYVKSGGPCLLPTPRPMDWD